MGDHDGRPIVRVEHTGGAVTFAEPPVGLWTVDLIRTADGTYEPPLEHTHLQAHFDEAGAVMGDAGCNSYRGSVQLQGDTIAFGALATTRKLCLRPPGVMEQEARYLHVLAKASRYSYEPDDTLRLFDDSNELLLVMSRPGDAKRTDEG